MKKAALTIGLLAAALNPLAQAKEDPYAGVDLTMATLNTSSADISSKAVRLRVGSELTRHFGVELQTAFGITDETVAVAGGSLTGKIGNVSGAYLRSQYQIGDVMSVYGTLGYAWSRIEISSQAPSLAGNATSDTDVSAGVGVEMKILAGNYLGIDYMQYTKGLTAISIGLRIPL